MCAETQRLAAEKKFIHNAAKRGDGRTNLKSASTKSGFRDIIGMKRQGGLGHGEKSLELRKLR